MKLKTWYLEVLIDSILYPLKFIQSCIALLIFIEIVCDILELNGARIAHDFRLDFIHGGGFCPFGMTCVMTR